MLVLAKEYFNHGAPFREDCCVKFQAAPYVCQVTKWPWQVWWIFSFALIFSPINCCLRKVGSSISPEEHDVAKMQFREHNTWFKKHIVDEETIMILHHYSLDYRDQCFP